MSSKKKLRNKKYFERQAKREAIEQNIKALNNAENIKEMAELLKIKLK